MTEPCKLSDLLPKSGDVAPGPRRHPCARCSARESEYTRHDPSWTPPEAVRYVSEGRVYRLANCEPCTEMLFLEQWDRRRARLGSPEEHGLPERERANREYALGALNRERGAFYAARATRMAQQTSGEAGPGQVTGKGQPSGRDPGEAALTSGVGKHADRLNPAPARAPAEPAPNYDTDVEEWPF